MSARAARRSLTALVAQTFSTTLASQAAQFLAGVVVARALGPEGKGIVSLAGLLAVFGVTAADGLNNAICNQVGALAYPRRAVWRASLRIYGVVALAGTAIFATLWALHRDDASLLAVAVAFPFVTFMQTVNALYFVGHRIDRLNVQNTVATGIVPSALTMLAVGVLHLGVISALVIWVGGMIAAALWAGSGVPSLLATETENAAHQGGEQRAPVPPIGTLVRLQAAFGAKASLSSSVTYLSLRADTMIVGALAGAASFGIYTLAQALGELMWLVSRSIMWAATGRIATDPLPEAIALTARVVRSVLAVQFVLAAIAFAGAPFAIDLVYGGRFHQAGLLVQILLPGTLVYSADGTLGYFISVRCGRPGLLLALETSSLALCAALTFALLPRFGLPGAAVAHTIAYIAAFAAKAVYVAAVTKLPLRDLLFARRSDVPASLFAKLRLGKIRPQPGTKSTR